MPKIFILTAAALLLAACTKDSADRSVHRIIDLDQNASTHEAWHAATLEVSATKNYLFSGIFNEQEICGSLEVLTPTQLSTFYDDLDLTEGRIPDLCRRDLKLRLNRYLYDKRVALAKKRPKLKPCPSTSTSFAPSLEVELDNRARKTITHGNLPQCHINFTFDDGPHTTLTAQLLDILADYAVRANFFVLGRSVNRYPNPVRRAIEEGHVVGNHTMNHQNLPTLKTRAARDEIKGGFQELLRYFNSFAPFMRFPYGASTKDLKNFVYDNQWLDFFWNMDTRDWDIKDPELLYRNVLKEIERETRGVILFHDIHPQTIVTVPYVFEELREAGYTTVVFMPKELHDHVR